MGGKLIQYFFYRIMKDKHHFIQFNVCDKNGIIKLLFMKVEIEYCTNCSEHNWCSHHDESKYAFYFTKIKKAIQQSRQNEENISVCVMQPQQHYKKKSSNPKDNKYIDQKTAEEFYFPRIGAFEIYVNNHLIYSKLRTHSWPNPQKIADIVMELYHSKQGMQQSSHYIKEQEPYEEKASTPRKKRSKRSLHQHASSKLIDKPSIQRKKLISLKGKHSQNSVVNQVDDENYQTERKKVKQTEGKVKVQRNSLKQRKDYKQIYDSAAYEMRQWARRERHYQKKINEEKINKKYVYPQLVNSEENVSQKKTYSDVKKKRTIKYKQMNTLKHYVPSTLVNRYNEEQEDSWTLSDLINQQEKQTMMNEKEGDGQTVNHDRIARQKEKYERLLHKLKNEEKSYQYKLSKLNQRLGVQSRSINFQRPSQKTSQQNSDFRSQKFMEKEQLKQKASKKQASEIVLPKISNEMQRQKNQYKKVQASPQSNNFLQSISNDKRNEFNKTIKVSDSNRFKELQRQERQDNKPISSSRAELQGRLQDIQQEQKQILQKLSISKQMREEQKQRFRQLQRQIEREKEKQRERQRQIERQKQRQRERERQIERQREKQRYRQRQQQIQKQRTESIQRQRERERQLQKEIERIREKENEKYKEKLMEREKSLQKYRTRQRQRDQERTLVLQKSMQRLSGKASSKRLLKSAKRQDAQVLSQSYEKFSPYVNSKHKSSRRRLNLQGESSVKEELIVEKLNQQQPKSKRLFHHQVLDFNYELKSETRVVQKVVQKVVQQGRKSPNKLSHNVINENILFKSQSPPAKNYNEEAWIVIERSKLVEQSIQTIQLPVVQPFQAQRQQVKQDSDQLKYRSNSHPILQINQEESSQKMNESSQKGPEAEKIRQSRQRQEEAGVSTNQSFPHVQQQKNLPARLKTEQKEVVIQNKEQIADKSMKVSANQSFPHVQQNQYLLQKLKTEQNQALIENKEQIIEKPLKKSMSQTFPLVSQDNNLFARLKTEQNNAFNHSRADHSLIRSVAKDKSEKSHSHSPSVQSNSKSKSISKPVSFPMPSEQVLNSRKRSAQEQRNKSKNKQIYEGQLREQKVNNKKANDTDSFEVKKSTTVPNKQEQMPSPQFRDNSRDKIESVQEKASIKVAEENSSEGRLNKQFPKIELHVSKSEQQNSFLQHFQVGKHKIKKISGDELWHCLKCEEVLPNHGKYSIAFELLHSQFNCVEVGIMPKNYHCIQNKICDKAIGLNVANGKIHDTDGNIQKQSTKWREVFSPLPNNELILIEMNIDYDLQLITWRLNKQEFARSVITNYLKSKKCVPYITMVHVYDVATVSPKERNPEQYNRILQQHIQPQQPAEEKTNIFDQAKENKSLVSHKNVIKLQKIDENISQQNHKEQDSKKVNRSYQKIAVESHAKESQNMQEQSVTIQPISISISRDSETNPFEFLYSFDGNRVKKIQGDGFWHSLKSEQVLANEGRYVLSFNIEKSHMNFIEVGIMPFDYVPVANKLCDKSIGLHLGNGKIHDTSGDMDKKSTKWRVACQPFTLGEPICLQMDIDADAQKILWKVNNTLITESVITNYLKYKYFVAYCSLVHKDDEITLNSPLRRSQQKEQNIKSSATKSLIKEEQIHQQKVKVEVNKEIAEHSIAKVETSINNEAKKPQNASIVIEKNQINAIAMENTLKNPEENRDIEKEQIQKIVYRSPEVQESVPQKNYMSISQVSQGNVSREESKSHYIINQTINTNAQKNPFVAMYEISQSKLRKISGDGLWHSLKAQEILPVVGKYSLSYKIERSKMNCIEFGIMPKDFIPSANKVCDKSIGFHLANGKIHDTNGDIQKKATTWRAVCQPGKVGQVSLIELRIDADLGKIRWKIDGKTFAQSVITNYLRQKEFVSYVSFLNREDEVMLNAAKTMSKLKVKETSIMLGNSVNKKEQKREEMSNTVHMKSHPQSLQMMNYSSNPQRKEVDSSYIQLIK